MAVVYNHKRLDTGTIFYVGIGLTEARAYQKKSRSLHWKSIVNKCGYSVEVTHTELVWNEACSIEMYLISFYGRKDLGKGLLVNKTDGGEGTINAITSDATRVKISVTHKGKKQSPEFIKKRIGAIKKKTGTRIGTKFSDETKKKISESGLGRVFSEEHKYKISEAKKKGSSWNKGISVCAETKKKISESLKKYNASKQHSFL